MSGEGMMLIAVVSDGAGSASRADFASQTTCLELIRQIETWVAEGGCLSSLARETVDCWIDNVIQTLRGRAKAEGKPLREYASTLIAALVGDGAAAFFQVGDGAIVVSEGVEDGWSYVFWPQHGEFANTTNFVISATVRDVLEFQLVQRRVSEIALFTDGIENLVLHHATRSAYQPFFNQIFKPVRASLAIGHDFELSKGLVRYLSQPAICERTDDDKSLVLATRVTTSTCSP
jgi:Protein phosphatase 2C